MQEISCTAATEMSRGVLQMDKTDGAMNVHYDPFLKKLHQMTIKKICQLIRLTLRDH